MVVEILARCIACHPGRQTGVLGQHLARFRCHNSRGHFGHFARASGGVFTPCTGVATVGQRLLGIVIMTVDRRRISVVQATLRTLLLCLAVPALIWDRDSRGLHDKAAATVLVRR